MSLYMEYYAKYKPLEIYRDSSGLHGFSNE